MGVLELSAKRLILVDVSEASQVLQDLLGRLHLLAEYLLRAGQEPTQPAGLRGVFDAFGLETIRSQPNE